MARKRAEPRPRDTVYVIVVRAQRLVKRAYPETACLPDTVKTTGITRSSFFLFKGFPVAPAPLTRQS